MRIKSIPVAPELVEQALLDGGLESQVESYGVNGSDLLEQGFDLLLDGEATPRHRLGDQQAGQDSILFRHVTADREAGALLAAQHDLILFDELPDVLEPYRSLVDRNVVILRHGVDQVGGGDAAPDSARNLANLDQVVGEQGQNVIGMNPRAISIHNAEAVRVAVG